MSIVIVFKTSSTKISQLFRMSLMWAGTETRGWTDTLISSTSVRKITHCLAMDIRYVGQNLKVNRIWTRSANTASRQMHILFQTYLSCRNFNKIYRWTSCWLVLTSQAITRSTRVKCVSQFFSSLGLFYTLFNNTSHRSVKSNNRNLVNYNFKVCSFATL
jgi:hypothetical protein